MRLVHVIALVGAIVNVDCGDLLTQPTLKSKDTVQQRDPAVNDPAEDPSTPPRDPAENDPAEGSPTQPSPDPADDPSHDRILEE